MAESIFEESSQDGKLYYVRFPRILKDEYKDAIEKAAKSWLLRMENLFVFDFKETLDMEKESTRILFSFIRTLSKNEKKLVSINLSSSFENKMKERGLNSALNIKKNLSGS